jgi:hypothetical protein
MRRGADQTVNCRHEASGLRLDRSGKLVLHNGVRLHRLAALDHLNAVEEIERLVEQPLADQPAGGASPDRGRIGRPRVKCRCCRRIGYRLDGPGDDYRPQVQGRGGNLGLRSLCVVDKVASCSPRAIRLGGRSGSSTGRNCVEDMRWATTGSALTASTHSALSGAHSALFGAHWAFFGAHSAFFGAQSAFASRLIGNPIPRKP